MSIARGVTCSTSIDIAMNYTPIESGNENNRAHDDGRKRLLHASFANMSAQVEVIQRSSSTLLRGRP